MAQLQGHWSHRMPHKSTGLAKPTGAGLKRAWLAQGPPALEAEMLSISWSVQMN